MRIGDNRTAEDMSEWIGSIKTTKKTLATGLSSGVMGRELTKSMEMNRRSSDAFRDGVTLAEDEEELVSAEELKHEMSAEKGLAWFDLGDGRLRKGRAFWFNADLPASWEGREYLVKYESVEADEIGLAEWVDEHILETEQAETEREFERKSPAGPPGGGSQPKPNGNKQPPAPAQAAGGAPADSGKDEAEAGGSFRFNLMTGKRGRARASTFVTEAPNEAEADKNTNEKKEKNPTVKPETSGSDGKQEASKKSSNEPKAEVNKQANAAKSQGSDKGTKENPPGKGGNSAKTGGLRFGRKGGTIVDTKS
jgi:hypothetical protein